MSRKKINEIRLLTGISILLVVAGHLASRGAVEIPLYVAFKKMVYKFHMPLFMFLSGFVAFYSYHPVKSKKNYFDFFKKKTFRFLPAYLILSFTFIMGEFFLTNSKNFVQNFNDVLFFPSNSPASFLWYIYVLYMYYLILPLMFSFKNKLIVFLPFCFVISFFDFTKFMAFHSFFWYLPFFISGGIVSLNYFFFKKISRKFGLLFFLIFITLCILEFNYIVDFPKQIVAFFSIIGLHYFVTFVLKTKSFIEMLGENSFYIYLFNTLFIGAINVFLIDLLGKVLYYDLFYYLAPVLVTAGVALPILLQKYIISRLPIIKHLIR